MKAAILPVTPLQQNCSLIWCTATNKAALVDPGGDLDKLKGGVAKAGVELEKILITIGHLDHARQGFGVSLLLRDLSGRRARRCLQLAAPPRVIRRPIASARPARRAE
jgi:hypothetical protein